MSVVGDMNMLMRRVRSEGAAWGPGLPGTPTSPSALSRLVVSVRCAETAKKIILSEYTTSQLREMGRPRERPTTHAHDTTCGHTPSYKRASPLGPAGGPPRAPPRVGCQSMAPLAAEGASCTHRESSDEASVSRQHMHHSGVPLRDPCAGKERRE